MTTLAATQADLQDPRTAQLIAETLTGAECKPLLDEVPALPTGSFSVAPGAPAAGGWRWRHTSAPRVGATSAPVRT